MVVKNNGYSDYRVEEYDSPNVDANNKLNTSENLGHDDMELVITTRSERGNISRQSSRYRHLKSK